jgi:hypothetical protein
MPVLAIGAEKAFSANVAAVMRNAATIAAVRDFLAAH